MECPWSRSAERAALFLRACASGAPCAALAESVLEDQAVQLALDVLHGDEHRYAKVTRLASRVLDAVSQRAGAKKASRGDDE